MEGDVVNNADEQAASDEPTPVIQLTNEHPADLEIPGRDESFGVLIDVQAMGDFLAFGTHDLPALRIDLGPDPEAGLTELLAAFAEALA